MNPHIPEPSPAPQNPSSNPRLSTAPAAFRSTWHEPLPDDEIGRQQQMKERLSAGMEVELRGLGRFIYSGIWDTMHAFYPSAGQDLPAIVPTERRRYLKRDLRGRHFIQLPYTLLADEVVMAE